MTTKAKRRIHGFDFTRDHHHVALVDKAANLTEVLVMKGEYTHSDAQYGVKVPLYEISENEIYKPSKEVRVELSMHTFLQQFFNMYHSDANMLCTLLGYDTKDSWDEWYAGDSTKVELLKHAVDSKQCTREQFEILKAIYKKFGNIDLDQKIKENEMDLKEMQKAMEEQAAKLEELQKSLETQAELHKAEIEKAEAAREEARLKAEELEKAAEAAEKSKFEEVIKGYSFITEDAQERVIETLFKARKFEGMGVVIAQLEKAQEVIDSFATDTHGVDGEGKMEETEKSAEESAYASVMDIIKARKENK